MCSRTGRRRRSSRPAACWGCSPVNKPESTHLPASVCGGIRHGALLLCPPPSPAPRLGVCSLSDRRLQEALGWAPSQLSTPDSAVLGALRVPSPSSPPLPLHQPPLVWPDPWGILPDQCQLVPTAAPAPGVPGTILLCPWHLWDTDTLLRHGRGWHSEVIRACLPHCPPTPRLASPHMTAPSASGPGQCLLGPWGPRRGLRGSLPGRACGLLLPGNRRPGWKCSCRPRPAGAGTGDGRRAPSSS